MQKLLRETIGHISGLENSMSSKLIRLMSLTKDIVFHNNFVNRKDNESLVKVVVNCVVILMECVPSKY